MHWRARPIRAETIRGTGDDEAFYAAGWMISGLATLGMLLAVWAYGL